MKAVIVFHSVCGNVFLLAEEFRRGLAERGWEVLVRRAADADFDLWRNRFPAVAEYADALTAVEIAAPDELRDADLILLGSPTCYGNVSGEMKMFLDTTGVYYREQPLLGVRSLFFTSSASVGGGGNFCLDALWRFAQHMGMTALPIPLAIQMMSPEMSAYGISHVSGPMGDQRPGEALRKAIGALLDLIV